MSDIVKILNELREIMSKNILMVNGRPVKNTSKKDVYKIMEVIQDLLSTNSSLNEIDEKRITTNWENIKKGINND